MRSLNIDRGWQFQRGLNVGFSNPDKENSAREVNLPHDYMIESNVSEEAAAGSASGYCFHRGLTAASSGEVIKPFYIPMTLLLLAKQN